MADIVTLHVPLTPLTHRLITGRELALLKESAFLINTSRGTVVDEGDLVDALRNKVIAGAAIDVFEHEPYSGELCGIERCVLTAHMGSMSVECRSQMEIEAVEEAVRFMRGEPLLRRVPDEEYCFSVIGRPAANEVRQALS